MSRNYKIDKARRVQKEIWIPQQAYESCSSHALSKNILYNLEDDIKAEDIEKVFDIVEEKIKSYSRSVSVFSQYKMLIKELWKITWKKYKINTIDYIKDLKCFDEIMNNDFILVCWVYKSANQYWNQIRFNWILNHEEIDIKRSRVKYWHAFNIIDETSFWDNYPKRYWKFNVYKNYNLKSMIEDWQFVQWFHIITSDDNSNHRNVEIKKILEKHKIKSR